MLKSVCLLLEFIRGCLQFPIYSVKTFTNRQCRAGQGRAGQGRAGQGRAGQGRAGQGRLIMFGVQLTCVTGKTFFGSSGLQQ
jgi:hypothetical protein